LKTFLFENVFSVFAKDGDKNALMSLKNRLKIYEVQALPYLYMTNGLETVVSPYFSSAHATPPGNGLSPNERNLMVVMKSSCEFAEIYAEDFRCFTESSKQAVAVTESWIREFFGDKKFVRGRNGSGRERKGHCDALF